MLITIAVVYCICYQRPEYFKDLGSSLFFTASYSDNVLSPLDTPLKPLISPPLLSILKISSQKIPNILIYKPSFLSPVVNQGLCGSCWAFIVSDLLTNLTKILTNGKFKHILSAQQLINCYKPYEACGGQAPEDVFIWMEKNNVKLTTTKKIPYEQIFDINVNSKCSQINSGINIKKGCIKSICKFIPEFGYNENILNENILNMKKVLWSNGPFFASISVYNDLLTWKPNSVYTHSIIDKSIGGHAILIIGYVNKGTDKRAGFKNDGYWIFKNTWGNRWGAGGYGAIKMGENSCGVESRCGIVYPNIPNNYKINLNKMRITSYKQLIKYIKK